MDMQGKLNEYDKRKSNLDILKVAYNNLLYYDYDTAKERDKVSNIITGIRELMNEQSLKMRQTKILLTTEGKE